MVEEGGDELREGDGEVLDLSERGDRSEARENHTFSIRIMQNNSSEFDKIDSKSTVYSRIKKNLLKLCGHIHKVLQ